MNAPVAVRVCVFVHCVCVCVGPERYKLKEKSNTSSSKTEVVVITHSEVFSARSNKRNDNLISETGLCPTAHKAQYTERIILGSRLWLP